VSVFAIDFDRVIHRQSRGWQDGEIYDPPVDGSKEIIQGLKDSGNEIIIFTAREKLDPVKKWLQSHGFPDIPVTNRKPLASYYIDDRAIHFRSWKNIKEKFLK